MKFLTLLLTVFIFSASSAQSLTDVLFTKYSNRNEVSISTDIAALPKDSTATVPLSMTVNTLTVENEDGVKRTNRLMKQILRDCDKILSQKDYSAISIDKDGMMSHRVYKYHSGNITEIFDLEQEEERLTLTVTRITGLAQGNVNFKIQTSKGMVESKAIINTASDKVSQ